MEQVSGGNVFIRADSWSSTRGFTNAGWIAASSVDLFLHPHDLSNGSYCDRTFVRTPEGRIWRIAGGAPLYINSWDLFGGPQPTVAVNQWSIDNGVLGHLHQYPADGTILKGLPSGAFWQIAGGCRMSTTTTAGAISVNDYSIQTLQPCT